MAKNYPTLSYISWNSLDQTASTFTYASILSKKIVLIYRCFLVIANRWSHNFSVMQVCWADQMLACVIQPGRKNKTILDCVLPVSTQVLQKPFFFGNWRLSRTSIFKQYSIEIIWLNIAVKPILTWKVCFDWIEWFNLINS